jgi:hypothetical protein
MQTPRFPDHPFTLEHLRALGITRHRLDRAVADGRVRQVVRGAYAPADLPDTVELRAAAIALVVSEHHVIVDRCAAWLHGIDAFTWAEHDVLPPIEVCAIRGRNPTHLAGVDGGSRDLAPRDIQVLHGVRVTTPLRTALDLGCNLRRREAYAVLNSLAREHGLTRSALSSELLRFRRRRGVIQLRDLVPLVEPRIESERESWTYLEIVDAGLPLPEPQLWIEIDGVPTYRLDFAYPRVRVCVEYDGYDAHERTAEQKDHDRERRTWLREHDWTVIVVRRGDFTGPGLDRWLRELAAALRPSYSNRRW